MPAGLACANRDGREGALPLGTFEGSGTNMKKVALTAVAVLGLGLAACQNNAGEENAANETAVENNAELDTNAATNAGAEASADAALNNLGESAGNVADAAENVASDAANAVDTNNQ